MTEVLQNILNALSVGGTYALLALGLAMVFSVFGLINFAHGELMTIAGYAIFFALGAGIPFILAAVLGVAAAGLGAVSMERVVFRPLRGASVPILLLASMALGAALQVLFQDLISARPEAVTAPGFLSGTVSVGQLHLGVIQSLAIVITIALLIVLTVFLRRTTLGISMRAAAEDFQTTRLMGIRADRVIGVAFLGSGLLAGVAAVSWVAVRGSVDPLMGQLPMFKAFIAVIIGGVGSFAGAVAGGLLLGAIEVGLQSYLPSNALGYQDAIAFGIVIAVLLVKPRGLFAAKESGRD